MKTTRARSFEERPTPRAQERLEEELATLAAHINAATGYGDALDAELAIAAIESAMG